MKAARIDTLIARRGMDALARSPRALTRPGMRYVQADGALIRLRLAGAGAPTIVFAPDPPNLIEHYDALMERLAPRVRVLCFELPAFGLSFPDARFDFSLDRQAATLEQLLRDLALGPYVSAISCAAGLVALRLAARAPDLIERIVVIQTPSLAEEIKWAQRVDSNGLLARPFVGQALMAAAKRRVARGWYRAAIPDRATAARFDAVAQEGFDRGARYCLASGFQALRRGPAPEQAALRQPALVLWGNADRTHRKTDKRSLDGVLPDARHVAFEEAGHFPELEQPERFASELFDFLERPS
jgi:pimeloyl-ACP methyl ester carboxylesterase